ncbi:hypothetical protein RDV64_15495 [Acuticoccus sp. MNP-M23]|uniref:hypothetical protein n=1 Tax=Acuticoccus sp. MNP-M23 TaxID=3072793 RepID=UPI00281675C4|nr:hypothetical protein [Acuticoccus sp. MNP-M23]WMS41478.1 hypothetical protein RDV64_15495 [Acuticoccus sp. MNP-M23]
MSDDVLANYDVKKVHAWYLRLAAAVAKKTVKGKTPLSAQLLKTYLTNKIKGATVTFTAPNYLQDYFKVTATLQYHRDVFLSEKKARIGKATKWAGLVPRLDDKRWDGISKIAMSYESLCEIGSGVEIVRIQMSGTDEERDLFTSLRGFQLHSDVEMKGRKIGFGTIAEFVSWNAVALDVYDFDYGEHLTMPNPDYGSKSADAIAPGQRMIRVYHKNAQRIEKAGLAAPYKVKVGPWKVTDTKLLASHRLNVANHD